MFPASQLNKVYIQKSLKNTPEGFEFILKNVIDSGTLSSVKSLLIDGNEVSLSSITIKTATHEYSAASITYNNSVPLRYSAEALIRVTGKPLDAGRHEIKLTIAVMEAGRVEISFTDEVS